ncbi:hypothetical protein PTTG_00800 [Puccinia triticina 1-1 BBBD Race 1]|uniref:Uncharacterized protein n=1 Tax=Puccinia triticina (isolate 1-1 / race 1 (BBBD)) TaxID=630390 RepID=A0A180H577_PUCT1|nr:hypothetical protein PTTG_00800 [Puccinia triticina 1-1 BBBD Race 1]
MDNGFSSYIDHGCILDRQGYPLYPNGSTTYVLTIGADIKNFGAMGVTMQAPRQLAMGKLRSSSSVTHPKSGWGLLRHRGFHHQQWPSSKKPDPLAKKDLMERIQANPKASALQLKIGQSSGPGQPSSSVVNIHELLGNSDRLWHLQSQILQQINFSSGSGGDNNKFMTDLFEWQQNGLDVISMACTRGQEHITFQTDWMPQRLLDCGEQGNKLYSGGLISDVTYRFFATGFTTSMYCDDINQWIPFMIPSLLPHERKSMARSLVDFSKAQQKGFIAAYMDRNCAVIMPDEQSLFESKCLELLQPDKPEGPTHDKKIDKMRRRFPKIKAWLNWWTMANVEAMFFPSRRKMLVETSSDGNDGLPSTTNAQVSMHQVYYMFRGKQTNLFHVLVSHFTAQMTKELIENKNLKSTLTCGSHKLFNEAHKPHPHSFVPGEYASCDFFMEIVLDPKTYSSKVLETLFSAQETQNFTCSRKIHNKKIVHPRGNHHFFVLAVTPSMFANNDEEEQQAFMGQKNWPFKLTISGEVYTLILRGFWGAKHYWDGQPASRHYQRTAFAYNINRIRRDNPKITLALPFAHMKSLLNLSYNSDVHLETLKPETDLKLASNRRHTYHGNIGDNISDESSSGGSSDSDYSGNHSKDDPSNDGSEYKACGPALSAPIPCIQPIKIRLRMNKTQPTPSSKTSPK